MPPVCQSQRLRDLATPSRARGSFQKVGTPTARVSVSALYYLPFTPATARGGQWHLTSVKRLVDRLVA